jgi:hypothetical protein
MEIQKIFKIIAKLEVFELHFRLKLLSFKNILNIFKGEDSAPLLEPSTSSSETPSSSQPFDSTEATADSSANYDLLEKISCDPLTVLFDDLAFKEFEKRGENSTRQKLSIILENIKHQKKILEHNQITLSNNLLENFQNTTLKTC